MEDMVKEFHIREVNFKLLLHHRLEPPSTLKPPHRKITKRNRKSPRKTPVMRMGMMWRLSMPALEARVTMTLTILVIIKMKLKIAKKLIAIANDNVDF